MSKTTKKNRKPRNGPRRKKAGASIEDLAKAPNPAPKASEGSGRPDVPSEPWDGPGEPVGVVCVDASAVSRGGYAGYALDQAVAVPEVRSMPVALMGGLPMAWTLLCETAEGQPWWVTTRKASHAAARQRGIPCLVARELVAVAHAAQEGRFSPRRMCAEMAHKAETGRVLGPREAFGGMPPGNAAPLVSTVGQMLDRTGCTLVRVEVHE